MLGEDEAQKILSALELPSHLATQLTDFPLKGNSPVVPTDPLIYRFYEIMQVYGMPLKSVADYMYDLDYVISITL